MENVAQAPIADVQGLPDDFTLEGMTLEGATKVVGNGVPLPLGRAIAKAIRDLIMTEH